MRYKLGQKVKILTVDGSDCNESNIGKIGIISEVSNEDEPWDWPLIEIDGRSHCFRHEQFILLPKSIDNSLKIIYNEIERVKKNV